MSSGIIAASIVAVAGIGTAMYSSQQAKKAAAAGKPDMVDTATEQKRAIASNVSNEADIEALLARNNEFSQSQASSLMDQAMPGYKNLAAKLTDRADKLASDPYAVPDEVQQNMTRLAAEKGIVTGRQGQAGQFSLLRDLGVNQLQYGQQNIAQAQSLTQLLASIAPRVNPMSPSSMYISPNQTMDLSQANNNATAAANAAGYQADAQMWSRIGGVMAGAANMYTENYKPGTPPEKVPQIPSTAGPQDFFAPERRYQDNGNPFEINVAKKNGQ